MNPWRLRGTIVNPPSGLAAGRLTFATAMMAWVDGRAAIAGLLRVRYPCECQVVFFVLLASAVLFSENTTPYLAFFAGRVVGEIVAWSFAQLLRRCLERLRLAALSQTCQRAWLVNPRTTSARL